MVRLDLTERKLNIVFYFKVDLRAVTPGKGGYYYPEHAPLLGKGNFIFIHMYFDDFDQ